MKAFEKNLKRAAKKKSQAIAFSRLTDAEVAARLATGRGAFLMTAEWKELRAKVVAHYGGKCMKCGCTPHRGVNVDHIKPRKTYPELALVFENLQVLCGPCNKAKGNKHETDYRAITLGGPMDECEVT